MSIYGMNMDLFSSSPIVILKVEDENRYLPIWIGQAEARSILFKLQNQEFVRPLTHDLALSLVNELGRSEEHTSELQSHRDLHSFPTRRSSDLDRPGGGSLYPVQASESGVCQAPDTRPRLKPRQ